MYKKLAGALRNLHRDQRGITGLETAIILIAFVTVASIVAYSVLSAAFRSYRLPVRLSLLIGYCLA